MQLAWLSRENAYIFRISHIRNVRWIFEHGLQCCNSGTRDPDFVIIGQPDIIQLRGDRIVPVPPGGSLSDYVPFYFTPFSPMAYKIKTGHGLSAVPSQDLVILVASLRRLVQDKIKSVFTDRHALLETAEYFTSLDDLDRIDWNGLRSKDFSNDVNDPEKTERYQAEALIYRQLPVDSLEAVICYDEQPEARLSGWADEFGADVRISKRPRMYF